MEDDELLKLRRQVFDLMFEKYGDSGTHGFLRGLYLTTTNPAVEKMVLESRLASLEKTG